MFCISVNSMFFLNQQYIVVKVETVLETAKVILEATIHSLQHADALYCVL